jgi:hypothetical protein
MQAARPASPRIVIALMLAVALLFAQWTGLKHRIFHASLQYQQIHASSIADTGDTTGDNDAGHSCAAFDAATVGDTLHILPFVTPLVSSARVLALWVAFSSWDAPLITCFSSRAPPAA